MSLKELEYKLSEKQIAFIKHWLVDTRVVIKLNRKRDSKLGDFMVKNNYFQISVNFDLAPELFFLTLTHEIAHLLCYKKFGGNIKPHGEEWKNVFAVLIEDSLDTYSIDFKPILLRFKNNPKANYYSFSPMVIYFDKVNGKNAIYLEDIPLNENFIIKGKVFVKKERRKIKYLCTEKATGTNYLIHPLAKVEKL